MLKKLRSVLSRFSDPGADRSIIRFWVSSVHSKRLAVAWEKLMRETKKC